MREAAKQLGRELLGATANNYRQEWNAAEYVRRLYATFLRRAPDKGFNEWVWQAEDNGGRAVVLEAFLSMGAYAEQADALYREILWLLDDQLGTPRLTAERTGKPEGIKRADYLPFGEEIGAGVGGRSVAQGYNQAMPRQTFSKKERDEETGLDYFLARYYSSAQGRFTSPDEFTGGPEELYNFADFAAENPTFYAELTAPQTLNKYQYCVNNPLRFIDPDGHQTTTGSRGVPAPPFWPFNTAAVQNAINDLGASIDEGLNNAKENVKELGRRAGKVLQEVYAGGGTQCMTTTVTCLPPPETRGATVTEVKIDAAKYPEAAKHITDAQKAGKPSTLTVDRPGAGGRRKASLKGVKTQKGKDRDEYPPAVAKEGGKGASVRPIGSSDNRGAGSSMGSQIKKVPNGGKIKIKVVNQKETP